MYRRFARSRLAQVLILALFVFFMMFILSNENQQPRMQNHLDKRVKLTVGESAKPMSSQDMTDSHIRLGDLYIKNFTVEGHRFNSHGVEQQYVHSLRSSVIHSFSPYTENRVREIMLEPRHEQRIYANR